MSKRAGGWAMELSHLRVFVAVAEELHFGRAALRLHLAQPSVSGQLQKLETELGVQLLRRNSRKVELTDVGAGFLNDARRVLEQADLASRGVLRWRDGAAGELRVGFVADSIVRALPLALRQFDQRFDGIRVQLRAGEPRKLLDDLRANLIDVAVVSLPASTVRLRAVPIGFERVVIASPSVVGDADERPVPLAMAARRPLLALPRRGNPAFYDSIVAGLRDAGLPATIVDVDVTSLEHLLLEVATGAGVALVPESAASRFKIPGVQFRHLSEAATIGCMIAAVTRDERPGRALEGFLGLFPSGAVPQLRAA